MKKSELVKMIREEVASILREKSMKPKKIKEADTTDPAVLAAQKKAAQADIVAKELELKNKELELKNAKAKQTKLSTTR